MSTSESATVAGRLREIERAKNTPSYELYLATVPKDQRNPNNEAHPTTPNHMDLTQSRRQFVGRLRAFKIALHHWVVGVPDLHKNDKWRTVMCRRGDGCPRDCGYAHAMDELREGWTAGQGVAAGLVPTMYVTSEEKANPSSLAWLFKGETVGHWKVSVS